MWDCPRPFVTGRGNGGSSPTPLPCPGAVLETVRTPGLRHPFVVQINSRASRSLTERFRRRSSASKSVVGPPQQGGKTRAERHGVTDGDEERRGESRNQIHFGPRNCRPKDFGPLNLQASASRHDRFAGGLLRPKSAALEPMSRSSESLFKPLELERAPEESLARRGMERHDVAGPPVTAALVPS